MTERPLPDKFRVAFSFAGEQRELIRPIASALEQRLGTGTVFFDEWYEHYIAGSDSDERLQDVYGSRSQLVIVCVSAQYGNKPWTLAEHEAIRALNMKLRASGDSKDAMRILPVRVGDGEVKGIPFTSICPDIRTRPVRDTTALIVNRLRLVDPTAGAPVPAASPRRCAYLAEVTPDLDDPNKPINRLRIKGLLEELGWAVLPEMEYPADRYDELLAADLARCRAFIQLRGPYQWKRGGFDRVQHKAAEAAGVPTFLYRTSDIDLTRVEPDTHRAFLADPRVMCAAFDDFLVFLEQELARIAQPEPNPVDAADPPLVRVVTKSSNDPEALWEQVFQWLFLEEKLLSDQLGPDESFEEKHRVEPCQGFLIVCDSVALDDGPMSPRHHMEQCRLIQIREKEATRRPPVALVYWPPPAPSWSKLLRTVPLKLYYATANSVVRETPRELGEFFAAVRRVAR